MYKSSQQIKSWVTWCNDDPFVGLRSAAPLKWKMLEASFTPPLRGPPFSEDPQN